MVLPPPCSARPFGAARFLPPPNSVLGRSGLRAEWGRPSRRSLIMLITLESDTDHARLHCRQRARRRERAQDARAAGSVALAQWAPAGGRDPCSSEQRSLSYRTSL